MASPAEVGKNVNISEPPSEPAPGPVRSPTLVWSEADGRWIAGQASNVADDDLVKAALSSTAATVTDRVVETGPSSPVWDTSKSAPATPPAPHERPKAEGLKFVTRYLPPSSNPREVRLHPADVALFDEMLAWHFANPDQGIRACLQRFGGQQLAADFAIYDNADALAKIIYLPQHPDVVLCFEVDPHTPVEEAERAASLRDRFEDLIVQMGVTVERDPPWIARADFIPSEIASRRWFSKLWISFETMCRAAEELRLRVQFNPAQSVASLFPEGGLLDYKMTHQFERSQLETFMNGKAPAGREWEVPMSFWDNGWRGLVGSYLVEHLTIRNYSPERFKARLNRLLADKIYTDYYPPHSGPVEEQPETFTSLAGLDNIEIPDQPEPTRKAAENPLVPRNWRAELAHEWAVPKLMWTKSFRQPIDKVRDYFGEKITWYFAWTGFYTALLIPLTIFSLVVFIYGLTTAASGGAFSIDLAQANLTEIGEIVVSGFAVTFDNALTPWYGIFVCAWATVMNEFWKRRTSKLSFRWDTNDYKHSEVTRPEWIGTHTRKSPITGRMEQYEPYKIQTGLRLFSWLVVLFCIFVVILAICGFIAFQAYAIRQFADTPLAATVIPALVNLVSIVVLDYLYKKIVIPWLLGIENWKKESEHENSYIIKAFLFDFVNLYGSLFYIGVVKPWVSLTGVFGRHDWKDTCAFNSCMAELMIQLVILFLVKQWISSLVEWGMPRILKWWAERNGKKEISPEEQDKGSAPYREDAWKVKYTRDDFWNDYNKIISQYGYISLFSVAFPLAAPLALLNNLVEIRTDASRLIFLCQRPFSKRVKDQGIYDSVISVMSYMSVMFNALIISFSSTAVKVYYLDQYGLENGVASEFGFALAFTGVVLIISKAAELLIPDISRKTLIEMEREEYMEGVTFFEWREAQDVAVTGPNPSTWSAVKRLLKPETALSRQTAPASQLQAKDKPVPKPSATLVPMEVDGKLAAPGSNITLVPSQVSQASSLSEAAGVRSALVSPQSMPVIAEEQPEVPHIEVRAAWNDEIMADDLDPNALPPTQRYRLLQQRRDRAMGSKKKNN